LRLNILSFVISLERDRHEFEVTSYLELLVNFGVSLEGVCQKLVIKSLEEIVTN
jgi:hypothetical protein